MKPSRSYLAKVIAAGFVVLLLLSIPLFWVRLLCEITLRENMPREARSVLIRPCGLVPKEIENDPNVARHSHVSADFYPWQAPLPLGTTDYFAARKPRGRLSNVYHYDEHGGEHCKDLLYFDKSISLLIYHRTYRHKLPDKTAVLRTLHLYAGPEGISETPDEALGRFSAPVTDSERYWEPVTLFDKKLRRFFTINFKEKTILKGPELAKDNSHNPIQVGSLGTSGWSPYPDCIPPMIKVPKPAEENEDKSRYSRQSYRPEFESIIKNFHLNYAGRYILVLDESGRIDLLDRKTLQFAGTAGYLPAPETFYPSKTSVRPKDLLSYRCLPVAIDREYIGMCVAGVSREGTAMAVTVFDSQGRLIRVGHTKITDEHRHRGASYIPSSKAVFFHVPWAPAMTTIKYLLENLHPPILSIASFFTADSFDPAAGHRTLFFLPNSFIAMKGREVSEDVVGIYFSALLLISPSIILAGFLARRVTKDAAAVGLSKNAKLSWIIATIAFGLSAYITYRLTRPKMTLVTCANCGRLRRPDMDKCHCCGSKWFVPELTPPAWRVLD